MIDEGTIARKLATLGSEKPVFRDGARVISNGILPSPINAILDEIDNTILRRKLTFRVGPSFMSFIVAGRRLLSLVATSDDLAEANPPVGAALSHEETEAFEAVGAALTLLVREDHPVLVESTPSEEGGARSDIGIPVDRLADLLEVVPSAPIKPMQIFVEACEGFYTACLFWSDGLWVGHAEDDDVLAELRKVADDQWERFRGAYGKSGQSLDAPRLFMLERALGEAGSVAGTWAQGEFALFVYEPGNLADIHAIWRKIFTT